MTLHWPLQIIWTNDVFNWEFNEQNRCSCAFPTHNYVLLLLLPDNSTDFEEVTVRTQLKKKSQSNRPMRILLLKTRRIYTTEQANPDVNQGK